MKEGLGGVVDIEDDVGLYNGVDSALNTEVFNRVVAVAQTCCVDDAEGCALNDKSLFDSVARGARYVADDGSAVVQQGVEEGGFSGIGTSDDGDGDSTFEGIAHVERLPQSGDSGVDLRGKGMETAPVGKLNVFVTEVEFQFQQRG